MSNNVPRDGDPGANAAWKNRNVIPQEPNPDQGAPEVQPHPGGLGQFLTDLKDASNA